MKITKDTITAIVFMITVILLTCGLVISYNAGGKASATDNPSALANNTISPADLQAYQLILTIVNPPASNGTEPAYGMPMIPATSRLYLVNVTHSSDPAVREGAYATLVLDFNPGNLLSSLSARSPDPLVPGAVIGISHYTYDGTYPPYGKIEVDIPIGTDWQAKVSVISSPVPTDSGAPILSNIDEK